LLVQQIVVPRAVLGLPQPERLHDLSLQTQTQKLLTDSESHLMQRESSQMSDDRWQISCRL
jgi:hypothetical protein